MPLADISNSVCANHVNGVNCYDCEIRTHVNVLCSHSWDIALYMISRNAIILEEPEHSKKVT